MARNMKFNWKVTGMSCNGCKISIEKAVGKLPGISTLAIDLKEATMQVELDLEQIQTADVELAVTKLGFTLEAN